MSPALRTINAITIAGSPTLLILSIWPGYAGGCWMLLVYPLIALLGLAWLHLSAQRFPRPWGRARPLPLRQIMIAPVVVCITYALLKFYVPRRIAFMACADKFDAYVANAPVSEYNGQPLARWLGVYRVTQYAADARGGVYFQTGTGPDGIGPDVMSYGFAHRPNRQGTPFGAAHYRVWHLHGDWYWFRGSDD
jgi:hypothetical protein